MNIRRLISLLGAAYAGLGLISISSLILLVLYSGAPHFVEAAEQNAATLPPVLTGQAGGGRAIIFGRDPAAARAVAYIYRGNFSYVRIEQQEPGAEANEHPAALDAARIRDRLAKVTLDSGKNAVFSAEDLAEITPHLVAALAQAKPNQDVTFAVSGKHGYLGLFSGRTVTTARVFMRQKQLNLIFGLVHADFEQQFQASGFLRPFTPGSRASGTEKAAIGIADKILGETNVRNDWVTLSVEGGAAIASTPPGAVVNVAPAASKSDELYLAIRERLKALDKLKADGLLSEQEYQDKRKAILKDL